MMTLIFLKKIITNYAKRKLSLTRHNKIISIIIKSKIRYLRNLQSKKKLRKNYEMCKLDMN